MNKHAVVVHAAHYMAVRLQIPLNYEEIRMSLRTLREFVAKAVRSVNDSGILEIEQKDMVVNRAMTEAIVEALRVQSPDGIIVIAQKGGVGGQIDVHNKGSTKRDDFDTIYTMLWVAKNATDPQQMPLNPGHAHVVFETTEGYEQAMRMLRSPENRHLFIPTENDLDQ